MMPWIRTGLGASADGAHERPRDPAERPGPGPRALAADGRLSPAARDPALLLAGGLVLARATLVAIANWIATLISGTPSPMLHRFLGAYVRYAAHVVAYLTLAANPYPGFTGRPELPDRRRDRPARPPEPLGHRLPPVPRAPGDPAGGHAAGLRHERRGRQLRDSGGVVGDGRLPGLVRLPRARPHAAGLPRPARLLRSATRRRSIGYLLLLTDRYPNSDPAVLRVGERLPQRPDPAARSTTTCGARA